MVDNQSAKVQHFSQILLLVGMFFTNYNPESEKNVEKVWIVIDENNSLKRCNVYAIPIELFEEYKNMPDYTLMDKITDSSSS